MSNQRQTHLILRACLLHPSNLVLTQVGSLWREYEAGQSPEARLVKDFDKLEMIIQVCLTRM